MGDYVWVEIEASKPGIYPKLRALYRGLCIITQKYNDLDFKVQFSKFGLQQVLHHNKLKPYEETVNQNGPRRSRAPWLLKTSVKVGKTFINRVVPPDLFYLISSLQMEILSYSCCLMESIRRQMDLSFLL